MLRRLNMVIRPNQRIHAFSNSQINIEIDGKSIEKVKEDKSLDKRHSWTIHKEGMSNT